MSAYTLYCFAQSGNAYKAALMLALCGADWEPRFVDYFNGETRTPAYRELNQLGEVPVLVAGDLRLSQSGVILDYLAQTLGRFGPNNDDERYEIMRWILWDNHKLTSYIGTLRYLVSIAKTGETDVTTFLRSRSEAALAILDNHLKSTEFVVANRPTIVDLSLVGYLFWPDEFGVSWDDYPGIAPWLERIKALDGWVHPYELMPGHPLPEES